MKKPRKVNSPPNGEVQSEFPDYSAEAALSDVGLDEADVEMADDELSSAVLPMPAVLEASMPMSEAGNRLDAALARLLPQHSRSRLQDWIRDGRVLLDGKPASDVKQRVLGGEQVLVSEAASVEQLAQQAEDIALDVVYEDDCILVINKPVGLVVHPGSGNWSGTLLNALLHRYPAARSLPRAGIVHRLDKDTSGLMVVARTEVAQTDLVRQLQARTVSREYLALLQGRLANAGAVDEPIGRDPRQRTRMAVVSNGRPALTHYTPLKTYAACTLVSCKLETGRTHQIRVHMASLGHPLVGDTTYGGRRQFAGLPAFERQALHACRLSLQHPLTHETLAWEAAPPADMAALLQALDAV